MLEKYWNDIPVGKENAVDYYGLCQLWGMRERTVRKILHDLSLLDNGDNYVLIRSSKNKGFYRSDDEAEIKAYRRECLAKGRSVFAPVKKCNRILNANGQQMDIINNLLQFRTAAGLKQTEVCDYLAERGIQIDCSALSRFENNRALPLPALTDELARLYGCHSTDLIAYDFLAQSC